MMKKPFYWLAMVLFLSACAGNGGIPNVTPTVAPATFAPTVTRTPGQIPRITEGTPYCMTDQIPFYEFCTHTPPPPQFTPTPSPTRTATMTRTPTRTPNVATSTPRPPTITPVGTVRAGRTPVGTPDCGSYDCMGPGLPNLPLLQSPTPIGTPNATGTAGAYLSPTAPPSPAPQTLIAVQVTPVIINGTMVSADALYTPVAPEDLNESDGLSDLITPVGEGGLDGDAFGNGGDGLGFDGENAVIEFGMSDNDTIWIAYAKGLLLDPNVNYFGPFSPLVALVMTYLALQFILLVANLFIPIIALTVGILRKIASTIADFTPF